MGLFKRAHVRGMVHELTRQGIVSWPSKLAADEAADEIADNEDKIPEVSAEGGLTEDEAQEVLDNIVEVANEIAEKTSGARDFGVNKEAAAMSYADAAMTAAITVMEKAAEETAAQTGPDIPGQETPTPEEGATAETDVDRAKVPSAKLVVPRGTSEVDTSLGAVGQEMEQAQAPGAVESAPTGEVAKLSSMLRKLASVESSPSLDAIFKAAIDGASLSGGEAKGTPPAPRTDLKDNLDIPGAVAGGRGQTSQDIPAAAQVGVMMKQPAGTPGATAPTPMDPAQDVAKKAAHVLRTSSLGRAFLKKISEEMKEDEECEKKKEEEKKEAAVQSALHALAQALR